MKRKLLLIAASAMMLTACQATPSSSSGSTEASSQTSQVSSQTSQVSSQTSQVSSATSSETHVRVQKDFECRIATLNDPEVKTKDFTFHYDSDYLESDAALENKPLALMAYGLSQATTDADLARTVFEAAGFTEHIDVSSLESEPDYDSIGYAIASRTLNGADQIIVSVRGNNYGKEWASNFYAVPDVPSADDNGDHYGMRVAAKTVVAAVKEFVRANGLAHPRYLFTGYSRGGAVAGLAAAMMIDEAPSAGNVYGYTFESPAAMMSVHAVPAYCGIFNYVNENDLIPMLMPKGFGFVRPGKTINTAVDLAAYAPIFEEYGLVAPDIDETNDFSSVPFKDTEGNAFSSGKSFFSFLIAGLTRELSEAEVAKGVVSFHTKDEYAANLQTHVITLMELFMDNGLASRFDASKITSLLMDLMAFFEGLRNQDGFDESTAETPYDPDALYPLVRKLLGLMEVYLSDDVPEELPEGAIVLDAEPIHQASIAAQALIRNIYMFLTKLGIDQGSEVDTARSLILSVLLVVYGRYQGIAARHYQDTTYALVRHYVETTNEE